jgi:16S rRNA (cytosine1402-N4)-methyltransferase
LEKIFFDYGEESKSKLIARAIVQSRKLHPITTTLELGKIIEKISFHPQTKARIFQAIRIEVNQELTNLEKSLFSAVKMLMK